MRALHRVSICIFNGISKLAHRRRGMDGRPYQIPYSLSSISSVSASTATGPPEGHAEHLTTDEKVFSASPSPSATPIAGNPGEALAEESPEAEQVIEVKNSFEELMLDDAKMKTFLSRFEDVLIKLLKPTEEGIPVPLPMPYPDYLQRPPGIEIADTYTTVIRRLYSTAVTKFSTPDSKPREVKTFPKKPRVPSYRQAEVIEQRQKSIRLAGPQEDRSRKHILLSGSPSADGEKKKREHSRDEFCPYSCPLCAELAK